MGLMRGSHTMASRINQLSEQGASYDLVEDDAWKAWKRIGVRPGSIVQWALGWLNHWPNSDSARLTLRQDIGALGCMSWGCPIEYWSDYVQKKLITREEVKAIYRLPDQKEVDRFLSLLGDCIGQLLKGATAEVGPLSVSVQITRRDRKVSSRGHQKLEVRGPRQLTDEAIYKVLQALEVCGGLVNRCPECDAFFLAERTNKMYCSIPCQNLVTSRRFREKQKTERSKRKKKRTSSRRGSADD